LKDYTVKSIKVGMEGNETNCYVLKREDSRAAVVVDPGDDADKIKAALTEMDAEAAVILLTHGHYDHILALDKIRTENTTVCIHKDELYRLEQPESIAFWRAPSGLWPFKSPDVLFDGVQTEYKIGGYDFEVIYTPGHTEGSVCYRFGDILFTGDTLFCRYIGRTDFAGGDEGKMKQSLRTLYELEGDFKVYPGHLDETTLDLERKYNMFIKGAMK